MAYEMIWKSDLENGTYKNPILYTDYSDSDAIRVKDTFYMTASSFNFIPGLPILISKDLVNWSLVNYATHEIPFDDYKIPAHSRGIWAPSIRYHDNKFWIFVGMPDEGIFMTNTDNPLRKWSKLKCIKKVKGFIDPCPLWDDDGKAYIVHAYAKSRIGFKSKLGIFEMSSDCESCISEDKFIFDGTKTQPTIEGPKIYKKNGYYYILAPAGGVKNGWQTALRSKNIYGPYEEKIVMSRGDTNINGPHQGALVDTELGEEYFLHFQDKGVYGRVTHLQPVEWKEEWPIIGIDKNKTGTGNPVEMFNKPKTKVNIIPEKIEYSDYFKSGKYRLEWQWMANFKKEFLKEDRNIDGLLLNNLNTTGEEKALIWNSANILTQKIVGPEFICETKIDFANMIENSKAGLVILGDEYASLVIEKHKDSLKIIYLESETKNNNKYENIIEVSDITTTKNIIYFKLKFYKNETCRFYYSLDDINWKCFKDIFSPKGGTWVGARIGIYAIKDSKEDEVSYAKFLYMKIRKLKEEK